MPSLLIAEYLDEGEAAELRERLADEGMAPIVKRHGLPRMFGVDATYRIFIDRMAAERGKAVVEQFMNYCSEKRADTRKKLSSMCPTCHSTDIMPLEKKSLWMRLRFFGVSVWKCDKCGNRWFI